MRPALLAGDWLVAESLTYRMRGPRRGEIVVFSDPREPRRELIKRVDAVSDGRVRLVGDAVATSTDSRIFGDVDAASVRWRARLRYWPPARAGLVR